MEVSVIGQIKNKKTGLGKAINDIIETLHVSNKVVTIDITNNKEFFTKISDILKSKSDRCYFTPSGSLFGNLRDFFYLLAMKKTGAKVIVHFHNSNFGKVVKSNPISFFLNKLIYKHVDKIILLGNKQKKMFDGLNINDNKFTIIRNGIDDELFISESLLKTKLHNPIRKVIFFSNMIPEKGYMMVLEVAKQFVSDLQYQFIFSGKFFDKALENDFINSIEGQPNIIYYPGVYGSEKAELLKETHFFILPSNYKDETLPISMLEAMAAGNYIIINDVGVVSEVVNEATSTISPSLTAKEIINTLKQKNQELEQLDFNIEHLKSNYQNKNIQEKIEFEIVNV
ncbi:TPA: glycosyltransferase family 4 protein [Streptococcus suis]|nr:glycosyltransferase family 4 protein [Streptococcus suis]